jgi:hypothetical protein
MNYELYHHGIKGMKWGVRRTPEQLGRMKNTVDSANNIVRNTGKISTSVGNMKSHKEAEKDVSKMSDEELKAAVKRMNMEQQYRDLKSKQTTSGQTYVRETLEIAGSALAITSSAIGIAVAIKQLKGG